MPVLRVFLSILVASLVLALLPLAPGPYEPLAASLATSVQVFQGVWLLAVVPATLGLLGLWPGWRLAYSLLTLFALLVAAVACTLGLGKLLGLGWLAVAVALGRWLKKNGSAGLAGLVWPGAWALLPLSSFLLALALSGPLTRWSRQRAMQRAGTLIAALKTHHARWGAYPPTLNAVWPDYSPGVLGIAQYHYSGATHTYQLYFEQPRFLYADFGVRELVVYCPTDQHLVASHASWYLLLAPAALRRTPGWHAKHPTGVPHWQLLRFD